MGPEVKTHDHNTPSAHFFAAENPARIVGVEDIAVIVETDIAVSGHADGAGRVHVDLHVNE